VFVLLKLLPPPPLWFLYVNTMHPYPAAH